MSAAALLRFEAAALQAKRAAYRDSSDREVEALQHALSIACSLLGVDESALDERAMGLAVDR